MAQKTDKDLYRLVKEQTLKWMRADEPFTYGLRLSKYGYKMYGIPVRDSFYAGHDKGFDWYNKHEVKTEATKFYACVRGANSILDYIVKHQNDYKEFKEDE